MGTDLNEEEAMLVETVREFIDRDVKPTVREVEHANTYPEAWIEQMKRIGIFGLAIGEEYGGSPVSMPCYVEVTQELARGWMSLAGAMGGAPWCASCSPCSAQRSRSRSTCRPWRPVSCGPRWR
jgi:alkylation response protein AidB-like acyl-CoA dehydrogenase